jgi:hypothetical protein
VRWTCVALFAPCVVASTACGASSSPRGVVVSSGVLQLAGIHWVLTQVSHTGKPSVVIPASKDASIEFHRDGTAVADDGVNGLDADFTATETTITLRNTLHGAVGYGGGDPVLDATTGGVGDFFDNGGIARYTITRGVLTINVADWSLALTNAGPLRGPTGAPAPTQS